jgi:hypothetical protein
MLFNPYTFKKYTAFIILGFMPVIVFYYVMSFYKNFWYALGGCMGGLLVGILIASLMIKNPFTSMLEGKGLLVFDLSSTGIIQPFIMNIDQPYIKGVINGKKVHDIYDRNCVYNLSNPVTQENKKWWQFWKKKNSIEWDDDKNEIKLNDLPMAAAINQDKNILNIKVDMDHYHKSRFGLMQYPVLLYNSQIKSLITKDFLSDQEKHIFSEHMLLYLNRKLEELNSLIRDFVRYIIEQLKPKGEGFLAGKGWLVWVIIIAALIVFALLFGKPIYNEFVGAGTAAVSETTKAATGAISAR